MRGSMWLGLGLGVLVATGGITATGVSASAAVPTLVVAANQTLRPVTHVATGSLYGLSDSTTPSDSLVQAIKPNTFVLKPIGGHQQPDGDIGQTWREAANAGAKVVDRLADYYAGWPYQFSWNDWLPFVDSEISRVKASGMTNLAAWGLWNEPDATWLSANGTFEDFWTRTYREVRSKDATTPIQGPSLSFFDLSAMRTFLQNAVNTNTVPDIIAWHELSTASRIAGDVADFTALENSLGITPRPIAIEEYATPDEAGVPGPLVGYIAKFERLGIHDAELPFWHPSGALGDLLTGRGGSPNAAYWLYTWYAQMSGSMVSTTPPSQTGLDGAASVTSDKKQLSVIAGGGSGATAVTINGLDSLSLGSTVSVKVEQTVSQGRTVAVSGPSTISTSIYTVSNGSITVPITMNSNNGYRITVTPGLAGTYTIANYNSGLRLDTSGSGTAQGTMVVQGALSNSSTQVWTLVDAGSGQFKIKNQASGLLLGIQYASTSQGAPALIWGDNGTSDHLWTLTSDGSGHYKIASVNSGLLLGVTNMSTSSGAQVLQWGDNGTPDHLWTLTSH